MKGIPLKELVPFAKLVSGFTADRDIVPAMKYLFVNNKTFRTFSGQSGAIYTVPWDLGQFAIPAGFFAQVLSSLLEQGFEDVEIAPGDKRVVVRAGRFKAGLPALSEEADGVPTEFIKRAVPKATAKVTPEFWKDIAKIAPAVTRDETQRIFRGVFWGGDGTLMATDNARLRRLKGSVKCPRSKGITIPAFFLQSFSSREGSTTRVFTGATVGDADLWFHDPEGAIWGLLLEGDFPAAGMAEVFKKAQDLAQTKSATAVSIKGDISQLLIVIDRLLMFAPTASVTVESMKNDLKISVPEQEGSGYSAEDVVPADVKGPAFTFTVNGRLLRDEIALGKDFIHLGDRKPLRFDHQEHRVESLLNLLYKA